MDTEKKSKIIIISSLLYFSIFIYSLPRIPIGPWDFGFLVSPNQIPPSQVGEYARSIHINSQIVVVYFKFIQLVTGMDWHFLALPGILVISLIVYSTLPKVRRDLKLLSLFIIVGGPLKIFPYLYRFRRTVIVIAAIFTFISLCIVFERNGKKYDAALIVFFSSFLWLTHYTMWPFFAIFVVCYLVLSHLFVNMNYRPLSIGVVALFTPLIIRPNPVFVYISSIMYMMNADINALLSILSRGFGKTVSNGEMIVSYSPDTIAPYMPEAAYLVYFIALSTIGIHYLLSHRNGDLEMHIQKRLFISGLVSFLIISPLFAIRGYLTRIIVLWPLLTSLFISDYLKIPGVLNFEGNGILQRDNLITLLFILIIAVHLSSFAIPDYPGPSEFHIDQQQIESGEFMKFTPEKIEITTDLNHASVMLIEGTHYNVQTGGAMVLSNGSILLNPVTSNLFQPKGLGSQYILVTTDRSIGTVTWGSVIPSPSRHRFSNNSITYTNGQDIFVISR